MFANCRLRTMEADLSTVQRLRGDFAKLRVVRAMPSVWSCEQKLRAACAELQTSEHQGIAHLERRPGEAREGRGA
jgi:hypothetical protein